MTPKEMEQAIEQGWDTFVETYEQKLGENFWTKLYWYAYRFIEDNDPDKGVCFEIRQDAISRLI